MHGEVAIEKSNQSFGCILEKDLGTTMDSSKKESRIVQMKTSQMADAKNHNELTRKINKAQLENKRIVHTLLGSDKRLRDPLI